MTSAETAFLPGSDGTYAVFAHLNAEKSPLYRAILRAFVAARARFALPLRPSEIQAALATTSGPAPRRGYLRTLLVHGATTLNDAISRSAIRIPPITGKSISDFRVPWAPIPVIAAALGRLESTPYRTHKGTCQPPVALHGLRFGSLWRSGRDSNPRPPA
jgi:hypothetical protein